MIPPHRFLKIKPEDRKEGTIGKETMSNIGGFIQDQYERIPEDKRQGFEQGVSEAATGIQEWNRGRREVSPSGMGPLDPFIAAGEVYNFVAEPIKKELSIQTGLAPSVIEVGEVAADFLLPAIPLTAASKGKKLKKAIDYTDALNILDDSSRVNRKVRSILATNPNYSYRQAKELAELELKGIRPTGKLYSDRPDRGGLMDGAPIDEQSMWDAQQRQLIEKDAARHVLPKDNEFHQLVMNLDKEGPYNLTPPGKFVSKADEAVPEIPLLEELTTQEIESLGTGFKTYMGKRPYKDAATPAGMERMQKEVNATFEQLLGPDFDQDLVRGYMKAVADHEGALADLQVIMNDKTGKLWDKQHSKALRHLEHSGRMLGNKGLFPAFNFPDVLDQTPLGKPKKKIIREGNRPDRTARGSDFQRTLARVLGKPLSLEESILYWYDQDMFYFWKELTPLQRQQLVDSSRTRSGGRIRSELTVAENINQALESMKFGKETMSGKLGRELTSEERLQSLVDNATANLLKTRKYKGLNKKAPRQGNVFYDINTGIETDYRPDLTGKGAYWDIESE